MLHTMIPAVIFLAIVLSFIPHDMMYGPQAALIASASRPRCVIAALARLPPVVGDRRRAGAADRDGAARRHGLRYAVAIYVMICAIVSVSATASCRTTRTDISHDGVYYDASQRQPERHSARSRG